MDKKWWATIIPDVIVVVIVVFVIALLIIKLLWAWVVPDILPGAVTQGLVAGTISWYTAFKLALVIGLIGGGFRIHSCQRDWKPRRRRR